MVVVEGVVVTLDCVVVVVSEPVVVVVGDEVVEVTGTVVVDKPNVSARPARASRPSPSVAIKVTTTSMMSGGYS